MKGIDHVTAESLFWPMLVYRLQVVNNLGAILIEVSAFYFYAFEAEDSRGDNNSVIY